MNNKINYYVKDIKVIQDILRKDSLQEYYRSAILGFTVLRRLMQTLEPTQSDVDSAYKEMTKEDIDEIVNLYKDFDADNKLVKKVRKEVDSTNIFKGANVVITGSVNDMDKEALKQLLLMLDSNVLEEIQLNIDCLIVGNNPDSLLVGKALMNKITILTEDRFIQLLSKSA